jgi:hypothetical protein
MIIANKTITVQMLPTIEALANNLMLLMKLIGIIMQRAHSK